MIDLDIDLNNPCGEAPLRMRVFLHLDLTKLHQVTVPLDELYKFTVITYVISEKVLASWVIEDLISGH